MPDHHGTGKGSRTAAHLRCAITLPSGAEALLGYACVNMTLQRSLRTLRLATLRATGQAGLQEIVDHNMALLADVLEWNREQGIAMFRLSSDLIPFGSHEAVDLSAITIAPAVLARITRCVPSMRLSMHPAQFSVLSTADPAVLQRSIAELAYHAELMERLGIAGDIVLHGGGVYGDRPRTAQRLRTHILALPEPIKRRLCLENDERSWSIDDLLPICEDTGTPLVVDNLHHALNGGVPLHHVPWARIAATWQQQGRRPKVHYSEQDPAKRPGAHSTDVTPASFLTTIGAIDLPVFDVMLECKGKEQALLRLVAELEQLEG